MQFLLHPAHRGTPFNSSTVGVALGTNGIEIVEQGDTCERPMLTRVTSAFLLTRCCVCVCSVGAAAGAVAQPHLLDTLLGAKPRARACSPEEARSHRLLFRSLQVVYSNGNCALYLNSSFVKNCAPRKFAATWLGYQTIGCEP